MCKTLYDCLHILRSNYKALYDILCEQANDGAVIMDSYEGAYITLYKLIESGLIEAIDLSPDSYYIIQALYRVSLDDMEQLMFLEERINK